MPGEPPLEIASKFRDAFFNTVSEQVDEFMRSEAYLKAMKQMLDTGLKFQKQYQNAMDEFRHSTGGVAGTDVDAIMRMLHRLETRILDRLEDMESRLGELKGRMDSSGNPMAGSGAGRTL